MKGCREGWIQFDPRKVAKRSNLAPVYISEVKTLKTSKFHYRRYRQYHLFATRRKGILRPVLGSRLQSHLPGMVCLSYDRRRYEMVSYRAKRDRLLMSTSRPGNILCRAFPSMETADGSIRTKTLIRNTALLEYRKKQAYAGAWPYFFCCQLPEVGGSSTVMPKNRL